MPTLNLGQATAIHIGPTPPENILILWYREPGVSIITGVNGGVFNTHYQYSVTSGLWNVLGTNAVSLLYERSSPTLAAVGGIPVGSSFGSGTTIDQVLDRAFYPFLGPIAAVSPPTVGLEFGNSNLVDIAWSATKRGSNISGLKLEVFGTSEPGTILNTTNVTPTGLSQTGSGTFTTIQNVNSTIRLTVTAIGKGGVGTITSSDSCSVTWFHRRFIFVSNTDLLSESISDVAISTILAGLANADTNLSRSELANSRDFSSKSLVGLTGQYIYCAYLDAYGAATFRVNTLPNNAFTFRQFNFTNQFGYTSFCRLYRSATGTGALGNPVTLAFDIN